VSGSLSKIANVAAYRERAAGLLARFRGERDEAGEAAPVVDGLT
jgi:hypothetical protein